MQLEWGRSNQIDGSKRVTEAGLLIGRDPSADVFIDEPLVSWRHAQIRLTSGSCTLVDLESRNGTYVDDTRIPSNTPVSVNSISSLRIGSTTFRLQQPPQQGSVQTQLISASSLSGRQAMLIGRGAECDIVLTGTDVSWNHAKLTKMGDGWQLTDLKSTNGTYVDERRIKTEIVHSHNRIRIGRHRISLADQEIRQESDLNQIRVDANNLTRIVYNNGRALKLLDDVSLTIEPREFVAIVGGSGAGKTTLLMALNGFVPATRGRVFLNGVDYYQSAELFRSSIGYVPQQDIVHVDLTVASALKYAARLRLPSDTSDADIHRAITRVVEELGLSHRINSPIKTLSGGERKRVNIGVELLTEPSLLFLDEPTTGLDAGLERKVVQQLRGMAEAGRTIINVTHSIQTITEYNKVIVMGRGGRLAYCGPPAKAPAHFGVNDFEGIYDVINEEGDGRAFSYPQSPPPAGIDAPVPSRPLTPPARVSQITQFFAVLSRYAEVIRSDPRNLISWIVQAPFVAVIVSVLFHNNIFNSSQTPDAKNNLPILDSARLMFLLAFSVVCFGFCNAAREIVKERPIYRRERHISLRIWPYLLSKVAMLSFVAVLQCAVILLIVDSRLGLSAAGVPASGLFVIMCLGAINAVIYGLLLSAWSSSADHAITLVAVVLLIQVIFSGLIPLENMNSAFAAVTSICITRWTYGGLCGVAELPRRWTDFGLGSQVHDLFRTEVSTASTSLIAMALVGIGLVWAVLAAKDRERD